MYALTWQLKKNDALLFAQVCKNPHIPRYCELSAYFWYLDLIVTVSQEGMCMHMCVSHVFYMFVYVLQED